MIDVEGLTHCKQCYLYGSVSGCCKKAGSKHHSFMAFVSSSGSGFLPCLVPVLMSLETGCKKRVVC